MYICKKCGRIFVAPRHIFTTIHLGLPDFEEMQCCPYCGGNFSRRNSCSVCGEELNAEYALTDECVCENCYREQIKERNFYTMLCFSQDIVYKDEVVIQEGECVEVVGETNKYYYIEIPEDTDFLQIDKSDEGITYEIIEGDDV